MQVPAPFALDRARQKERSSKTSATLRENRVFESFLSCGYFAEDWQSQTFVIPSHGFIVLVPALSKHSVFTQPRQLCTAMTCGMFYDMGELVQDHI
jgi:hypothetical protein